MPSKPTSIFTIAIPSDMPGVPSSCSPRETATLIEPLAPTADHPSPPPRGEPRNPDQLLSVIPEHDLTINSATYRVLIDTQPGAANLARRQAPVALRSDHPERLQALAPSQASPVPVSASSAVVTTSTTRGWTATVNPDNILIAPILGLTTGAIAGLIAPFAPAAHHQPTHSAGKSAQICR